MSRDRLRFVVAILIVAGGLALAPPRVEAAGSAVEGPDLWSQALQWIEKLWGGTLTRIWEEEGWMVDPNGGNSANLGGQEGGIDPKDLKD